MKSTFENTQWTVDQIMLLKLLLERVERNIKRLFNQDPYNNYRRIERLKVQRQCYAENLKVS